MRSSPRSESIRRQSSAALAQQNAVSRHGQAGDAERPDLHPGRPARWIPSSPWKATIAIRANGRPLPAGRTWPMSIAASAGHFRHSRASALHGQEPALGIAVSMGAARRHHPGARPRAGRRGGPPSERELPVGRSSSIAMNDQPATVKRSIRVHCASARRRPVDTVLAVSFLTLGPRTGLIVALSIPFDLAVTPSSSCS